MSTIFISYRREDSTDFCDRITDYLSRQFGTRAVFRDINAILVGKNFVTALTDALAECRVLLVIIGPHWLNAHDAYGRRRLDQPQDFVRFEIATALQSGKRVIPILVNGATLPSASDLPPDIAPLVKSSAFVVRSDPYFADDVATATRSFHALARWRPSSIGAWIGALGSSIGLIIGILDVIGSLSSSAASGYALVLLYIFPLPALIFTVVRSWRTHQWRWVTVLSSLLGIYVFTFFALLVTNVIIPFPILHAIFVWILYLDIVTIDGALFGFGAVGPRRPATNVAPGPRPVAPFVFATALLSIVLLILAVVVSIATLHSPLNGMLTGAFLIGDTVAIVIASIGLIARTIRTKQWFWLVSTISLLLISIVSYVLGSIDILRDIFALLLFIAAPMLVWVLARFGWSGATPLSRSSV